MKIVLSGSEVEWIIDFCDEKKNFFFVFIKVCFYMKDILKEWVKMILELVIFCGWVVFFEEK